PRVESPDRASVLLGVVPGREPRLAAADDHRVEGLRRHLGLLVVSNDGRPPAIRGHRAEPPPWPVRAVVLSDHADARQTRSCSKAKAVAAARDESPSFAKMF